MTRPTFILGSVVDSAYSPPHSPVPPRGIKQLLKEALMFRASFEPDANAASARAERLLTARQIAPHDVSSVQLGAGKKSLEL